MIKHIKGTLLLTVSDQLQRRGANIYLENGGEGTSRGNFVPVKRRAGKEDRDGEENAEGGNAKTPFPAFVVFDPNHECDCD